MSHATCESSSAMSMYWPFPLLSRSRRAPRIATAPYMPVMRSAMGTPAFCGPPPGSPSLSPVMLMRPPMAWIMKS